MLHTLFSNRLFCIGLIAVLCAAVLAIDLSVPLEVADGVLYIIPVFVTSRLPGAKATLWTAVVCSVLIIIGLHYSSGGGVMWQALDNGALSLIVVWVTAWFAIVRKRMEVELEKKGEETLKESEDKFNKAFYASPDAVAITSIDEGRIIDVNEAFERISGYPHAELINNTFLDLSLWANPDERADFMKILQEQGKVSDFESGITS